MISTVLLLLAYQILAAPPKPNKICFENQEDKLKFITNLHKNIKKDGKILFENTIYSENEFKSNCTKFFNRTEQIFKETKHCFEDNESYALFKELKERNKKVSFICEFDLELRDCEYFWTPAVILMIDHKIFSQCFFPAP